MADARCLHDAHGQEVRELHGTLKNQLHCKRHGMHLHLHWHLHKSERLNETLVQALSPDQGSGEHSAV